MDIISYNRYRLFLMDLRITIQVKIFMFQMDLFSPRVLKRMDMRWLDISLS